MEVAVATVIGKGLLTSALVDLYSFVKESTHSTQLEQVLGDLDIKSELDVVDALLAQLDKQPKSPVISLCIEQVNDTVNAIHQELTKIHEALEYHRTLYFRNWRSYGIDGNVRRLGKYKEILKQRTDRVLQVMNVQKALTEKASPKIFRKPLDALLKVLD